jgi:hypothetical protein
LPAWRFRIIQPLVASHPLGTPELPYGPLLYGVALATMIGMLANIIAADRVERVDTWLPVRLVRSGLRLAFTTSLVGLVLFAAPPFAKMPYDWEVFLAFFAWVAWCYRYGLLSRRRLGLAAAEAVPSVGLSVAWTWLLVLVCDNFV